MSKIIIWVAIFLIALSGWAQCWYKFCTSDFKPSYKREVIYGLGIVTGTGALIGWFNIED